MTKLGQGVEVQHTAIQIEQFNAIHNVIFSVFLWKSVPSIFYKFFKKRVISLEVK